MDSKEKKILVVSYSLSGQIVEILDDFLIPFREHCVDRVNITPKNKFSFPWNINEFFNVMPECVLEDPIEIDKPKFKYQDYDLIVFGYQPWFLSPSLPTRAIFECQEFQEIIKGKPIVTISGSRNSWILAQESMKNLIHKADGLLVGNIPLIDRSPNLVSAVTVQYWTLKGKTDRKWGIFPYPGVDRDEIKETHKYGYIVNQAMLNNNYQTVQADILNLNKIQVSPNILFMETRGKKIFTIWAKHIKKMEAKGKNRMLWIKIFRHYLSAALFLLSPLVMITYSLIIRPITFISLKRKKTAILNNNLTY